MFCEEIPEIIEEEESQVRDTIQAKGNQYPGLINCYYRTFKS